MDTYTIVEFILRVIASLFTIVGSILITYGGLRSIYKVIMLEIFKKPYEYNGVRRDLTNKIIFGLEFYIAADILETVLAPTTEELILLGAVVGIRTVLGYFLGKETKEYQLD
ncbi:DUF1622 domain-containing protein [Methanococcoides methylutens]|uniref:DUF1622 domain-containing protein n=1 Tax=Methanococcoides methylutens TaxID=2226 RepID=UPI0009DCCD4A|nr:DUF1622 domain-containing protein [Methanococcoides methylutens]